MKNDSTAKSVLLIGLERSHDLI